MNTMTKRKFSEYIQEVVNCWSDENTLHPEDVAYSCNKKFKFDCDRLLNSHDSHISGSTHTF